MSTVIIVVILLLIAGFSVKSALGHFKGEGGCCGGGGDLKPLKKKLNNKEIMKKTIHIEGMHCDHCKNTVERNINNIDGAVAKVNLKKNLAVVSMDREISDEILTKAVEDGGFTVVKIEKQEA